MTDMLELTALRVELVGFAYRMLGSAAEAEDAAQEATVRAWSRIDSYDPARASLRTWVFRIVTNICVDMLRSSGRRARPIDLSPAAAPGGELGPPLAESAWVQPIADERALPAADPAEHAVRRESIRLAFVAALQHLPPRQRAVLILRDVLVWHASEVADLLGTSVPAVNNALQWARATLAGLDVHAGDPLDDAARALLDRYCDAFARYDVAAMVALLHEDATMSMPPFAWWLRGRDQIRQVLELSGGACRGAWLVPVAANGSLAAWQFRAEGPFACRSSTPRTA